MSIGRKKVIVRRFLPGLLRGYLPPSGFVRFEGDREILELLDLSGRVVDVPVAEIKTVSFVREFNSNDEVNPERLPRRSFLGRPRTEGLWIRVVLRDEEQIEGLAPLDLSLAEGLTEDRGIQITPPDVRGNTQRMYVPRGAMNSMQVVAVVTSPARRKALETGRGGAAEAEQPELFPRELPELSQPQ